MDFRNIKNGDIVRKDGYSDQPYVVKTDDGHWLMTVTTGDGGEGELGQHVSAMRSCDYGKTWKDVVAVSSPKLPESSYSVLYKTKYGRVYCFYNYNADNIRGVISFNPANENGLTPRVDSQGYFVFKYSDDNGKSWSEKWYDIPQRDFECDRKNPYGGKIKFFWNVGKPFEIEDRVLVPLYKIRQFGTGFMEYTEGVLLECSNINTEKDPEKLLWQTLPDGDVGIRAPQDISNISEEHSFVRLSDGTVFVVFRTVSGHPYCAYSRDDCHTFSEPEPLRFANGRMVKHPRAANFIWKCENGKYLYWFHNNGGKSYEYRNPVFLSGATEYMTPEGMKLKFGEPVPVLYDENPNVRMSYPDMVEDKGEYYLTETQKEVARVHKIPKDFIESLWETSKESNEWDNKPGIDTKDSFSIKFETGTEVGVIYKVENLEITRCENGDIRVLMGKEKQFFINDDNILSDHKNHTVTMVVDKGISAVFFTTDGIFCDGGEKRQFGFTRFERNKEFDVGLNAISINKTNSIKFAQGLHLYD